MDLSKIEKYLTDNGYSDIEIKQIWRHVTGSVWKNGEKRFFKLSSTEEVAKKTRNEFCWNRLINESTVTKQDWFVPKNLEEGNFNGLYWYMCEFVEGTQIANVSNRNKIDTFDNNLIKIAQVAKDILEIKSEDRLPNDENDDEDQKIFKNLFLERIKNWMNKSDYVATDLYSYIESRTDHIRRAPSHGDFVPWNMLMSNDGKLFLIDGEHAKMRGFKFYDVAYLYHRIYTKLNRPDLASKFLERFIDIYKFDEEDKECFKVILAQRVVGGYFDASSDNQTSVVLQDELRLRILDDGIDFC